MSQELMKKRLARLQVIHQWASKRFEAVSQTLLSLDASNHKFVQDTLRELAEVSNAPGTVPSAIPDTASLQSAYDSFARMDKIDMDVLRMSNILLDRQYEQLMLRNMSSTYILGITNAQESLRDAVTNHLTISKNEYQQMYDEVINGFMSAVPAAYEFAIQVDQFNAFIAALMVRLLGAVGPAQRLQLESRIEAQKDIIMGAKRVRNDLLARACIDAVPQPLREGEIPKSGADAHGASGASTNAETRGTTGAIIITVDYGTPIVYNFDHLLDPNFEPITRPNSGLSKGLLRRFDTMQTVSGERAKGDPKTRAFTPHLCCDRRQGCDIEVINPDAREFNVYERLTATHWRQLGAGPLPREQLQCVLRGVSTRAQEYNRLQSDIIMAHALHPRAESIMSSYGKGPAQATDVIQSAVVNRMQSWFDGMITTIALTDVHSYRAMAVDEAAFKQIITDALSVSSNNAESLITHLARVDEIASVFAREMRKNVQGDVTSRTFSEYSGNALRAQLTAAFVAAAKKSAMTLDRNEYWAKFGESVKLHWIDHEQIFII